MSEPVPSKNCECPFDLSLINQAALARYRHVLGMKLQDLKKFFKLPKLYVKLTESIERYYPNFFNDHYRGIRRSDITYYYLYIYKLSLEESPQPYIWRSPEAVVIDLSSS